jgi:hypothetical protein
MSSSITDPIINNRICKNYSLFTVSFLSFSLTASPFGSAVTLHDYLYLIRTFIVLCRREPFLKNLSVSNFFNHLPRCGSGCKDAIIFNACQVLFSLIFRLIFSR